MPRTNFNIDPSAPFSSDSKTPIPQREPRNSGAKATSAPVDDIDRLLDDAEHKASSKVSNIPPGGGIPTISSTPTGPHQDSGTEKATQKVQPTEPQPLADATVPAATGRKGGAPPFAKGNPGRPRGVLVGREKLRRIKREREIARALAADNAAAVPTPGKRMEPREYFQQILDDVTAAATERRDAAKQLAAIDAKTDAVQAIEEINWDNLTSAQRRQGIDACKLLTDLRHISRGREPEFGMV